MLTLLRSATYRQSVTGNSENQMNHPGFKAIFFVPIKGIDWRKRQLVQKLHKFNRREKERQRDSSKYIIWI